MLCNHGRSEALECIGEFPGRPRWRWCTRQGKRVPVLFAAEALLGTHVQQPARLKLVHVFEDGKRGGHIAITKIRGERLLGNSSDKGRVQEEGFQLRSEQEDAAGYAEIQRFDAQPVASESQALLLAVPERECEHSGEPPNGTAYAPRLAGLHHYLGIGLGVEPHTLSAQLGSK